MIKIMSPYQHGEVFVTDDGAETDLDVVTMNGLLILTCPKTATLLLENLLVCD